MIAGATSVDLERLWGPSGSIRAFVSHRAEFREGAAELKEHLRWYGISAFLAHEDIAPTREWQDEILLALESMDVMIPLLTPGFRESEWTNQEVGYAICRDVQIIPVRRGADPCGFIGRYQAMNGSRKTYPELAQAIFDITLKSERDDLRGRALDAWVYAVSIAPNYEKANVLSGYVDQIKEELTPVHASIMIRAYNENSQVTYANGFRHRIARDVSDITGRHYTIEKVHGTPTLVEGIDPDDLPF